MKQSLPLALYSCADCAWYHRVWVLKHFQVDLKQELDLCKAFLREDQRNFHCWNYRRFVVQSGGISTEDELEFCEEKIRENFSNYSAFHQRSVFLKSTGKAPRLQLEKELSLVENAVFTEPKDQSAWWYHQFLLSWTWQLVVVQPAEEGRAELCDWFLSVAKQQLDLMRSLLDIEPRCHWVMTCLVNLLQHITHGLEMRRKWCSTEEIGDECLQLDFERKRLLQLLVVVDPMHSNRYQYILRKSFL